MSHNVTFSYLLRSCALVLVISIGAVAAAFADFDSSKVWFTSLTDEDRITLQTDLTLAGFYDAFIDGAFGPSTYRALNEFQKWNGDTVTGILSDTSIRALSRTSDAVVTDLDLQILQDERGQIEIAVPRALLPQTTETSVGTAYTRPDGLMRLDTVRQPYALQSFEELYRQLSTENARRDVIYQTYRDGYFVVSGSLDEGFFYSLMFDDEDQAVGFTLYWSQPYVKQGSIVSLFLASFATPWTEDTVAEPALPPASSTALPPSDAQSVIEIGNFLIFNEMPGVIGLRGEIGPSTPLDFRRALRATDKPKVLMLASDGGYVSSALLLAYAVREAGLSTYVLPETGCYSACSFVFFAGTKRRADGALGVHQVWSDAADASTAQAVVSDILEAFADFGVRQEVTSAMLRTRPEDMYVFSQTELEQWEINAGDPMAQAVVPSVLGEPALSSTNITTVEKTYNRSVEGQTMVVPVSATAGIGLVLRESGFSDTVILAMEQTLSDGGISTLLAAGSELRILYGPGSNGQSEAYRVTIHDASGGVIAGIARTDAGKFALVRSNGDDGGAEISSDGKGPRQGNSQRLAGHYVMLASQRTEDDARQVAAILLNRFGRIFRTGDIEIQRADLGSRGIYYRVVVPATSREDADRICTEVKAAGDDCFVIQ